jgi:hypothetical protein
MTKKTTNCILGFQTTNVPLALGTFGLPATTGRRSFPYQLSFSNKPSD